MRTVALVVAVWLGASCRFPELPALETDAAVASDGALPDTPSDGPDGPNVVITSGPAMATVTGPRVSFEFTVRDGDPFCRFDSEQLMPCTSPVVRNLRAGSHTFHVQAQNSTGGIDSDSRVWTVECLPRQATNETFGLFRMNEGTGTTVANEHPATPPPPNNHIRFADPPHDPEWTTSGRFGSALRFSAQGLNDTDRILSNILDPSQAISLGAHSIEMWLNPMPTYPHDLELFFTIGGTQPGHMDYILKFVRAGGQGTFRLDVRDNTQSQSLISQSVSLGVYHYVAISIEPGSRPLLFVDGTSMRTADPVSGTIDAFFFDALTKYEGDVDELHLTFHPYSETELSENWCPP